MRSMVRSFVSFVLLCVVLFDSFPATEACGPYYLTPVFDYQYAPENPFDDFAAGKLGIVKPTYHRVVLFAAYRYLNGGTFTADEQKALIDVWNADFNNKNYEDNDVGKAVKLWLENRKAVVSNEEKLPAIYTEREYGGYDFFPNCTKNAFETAAQTLGDRETSYGASSQDVKNWVAAQDTVFTNCASGKEMPAPVDQTAPEWLQKDRAYQTAAAEFYSLDYEKAKNDFAAIARDNDSTWRETANYLVARTLIRQASLIADEAKRKALYEEAELRLNNLSASGGKFADSSEKFMNLIKYRLRPQERVRELAQTLTNQTGNPNFRQDLIDYYWLLDKFEAETLEAEEKQKESPEFVKSNELDRAILEQISNNLAAIDVSIDLTLSKDDVTLAGKVSKDKLPEVVRIAQEISKRKVINNLTTVSDNEIRESKDKLSIDFYSDDSKENWTIYINPDATDEEAIAVAERVAGRPLTDKMKETVKQARQTAYSQRFTTNKQPEYEGGYYGEEKLSLSLMPDFLRRDDLTEWLFVYQMKGAEAYLYALDKFKQTNADLWLMTAISKAETFSSKLKELLEAASRTNRNSLAYPTIAYHAARILIAQGKEAEAVKVLDEVLNRSDNLPVSSRNQFLELRSGLAQTLDAFLRDSLKKPFTFDTDGESVSIDELIRQEKSYYDPEYEKKSKEDYEKEVEDRYKDAKLIENERMFDENTAYFINEHFSIAVLLEAEKSEVLPDYLKERIAKAIWTRAVLLKDDATANKIIPKIIRSDSGSEAMFSDYLKAKTPVARQNASLYIILKNESLTPYVASGFGSAQEGYQAYASRWWCAPDENEYSQEESDGAPRKLSDKPKFLTEAQSLAAQAELKKLKTIGDAPKFLGRQILDWAKRSPLDKRVPESLYIVYEANGWDKYGCGDNEELRDQIKNTLLKRYPDSVWTGKLAADEQ